MLTEEEAVVKEEVVMMASDTISENTQYFVFNYFDHQFYLHFEAFNLGLAPVYIEFIRFIGADDDEIRFWYSLEVGGFDRKLTWQGVPRSIHDSHKLVRDSLEGLIIHRSMTLFFSGGDMKELKL
ncbi:E3 ubiquitin-protein ligase SINAT5 [Capsicum chinense]|nr:E3 ubiquitin-protein ligase SINAT5 [Capsicum chinense]